MAFPRSGLQKQLTYLVLFPIIFPLWLTLPDTRNPKGESLHATLTFSLLLWQGAAAQTPGGGGGGLSGGDGDEDDNAPLDLSWPGTCRERLTYLLVLPIVVPLWLTLPDTRKASG